MAVFYRPSAVSLGGTTITTVTSVTVNENKSSGNFAGDNDNYAMGWTGAAIVTAAIALADINQAKALVGTTGSLVVTASAAAGGTDETTTITDMAVANVSEANPFDANSNCTLNLVNIGAGGASSPISG